MTDEQEKTKEKTTIPTTSEQGEGDEQGAVTSELDRADQIAERQKRENDRREALLVREENLAARRAVGGVTEAGQAPVKKRVMTDVEYAEALEKGEVNPLKEDGLI